MANRSVGKKRKAVEDLEAEKTLFGAFQQAAASVTSLYTLAAQQQKRSQEAGAKQALERVASWVFSQYAGSAVVPMAALLEFLRHELQDCGGEDGSCGPPVPGFHLGAAGLGHPVPGFEAHGGGDENLLGDQSNLLRRSGSNMQVSPAKRSSSHQQQQQQQMYTQGQQQQQQQGPLMPQQHLQHGFFPGA